MAFKDNKIKGIISNNTGNGIHSFGSFEYFQYTDANQTDPATNAPLVIDVATRVGFFSSNDSGSNLTEVVLSPTNITISAPNATLSNVTVWSANSILTQDRADSRYQATGNYLTSANLTWGNLTGKPTFANVATSGNYTDLANTPNLSLYYLTSNPTGYITAACLTYGNITGTPNLSLYLTTANAATTYLPSANFSFSNLTGKPTTLSGYGITDGLTSATAAATYLPSANFTYANISGTIPTATNTTLGAIKVGSNLTIANGVLSATSIAFQNGDTLNGGTF
jgi:hypothetical protein